jgi:hypothetical protein
VIAIPGSTYQSLAVAETSLTLPANANTLVCVNLIYGVLTQTTSSCPAWSVQLYQIGTGASWISYIQGRMHVLAEPYPMPEVAENPIACNSLGGVPLLDQSLCTNGNWLVTTSADPTTFVAEGLGTSMALDVNPQVGGVRLVPGRVPEANDYIYQGCFGDGAGTENLYAVTVQYTSCISRIVDPRPATRAGRLDLSTVDPANNGGTGTFARVSIGKGVWLAGAAGDVPGGDPGAYAINVSHIELNGVDVTSALVKLIGSVDPATAAQIRAAGDELAARPVMDAIPPRFPAP